MMKQILRKMQREPAFKDGILNDLDLWSIDMMDASGITLVGQIVCPDATRWPVQRETILPQTETSSPWPQATAQTIKE